MLPDEMCWKRGRGLLSALSSPLPLFQHISSGTTGNSIERKRCGVSIGAAPGAIKAWIDRSSGRDSAVIGQVTDGHCASRLRIAAVPELSNGLAVGEGEGELPAIDRRAPRIGNHNAGPETARPLRVHRVADLTTSS